MFRASGLIPNSGHNKKNDIKYGLEAMYDAKTLEASHGRQYQIGGSINKLLAIQAQAAGMPRQPPDQPQGPDGSRPSLLD
jgi:hypothetical protein